jgi:hypothetical protein
MILFVTLGPSLGKTNHFELYFKALTFKHEHDAETKPLGTAHASGLYQRLVQDEAKDANADLAHARAVMIKSLTLSGLTADEIIETVTTEARAKFAHMKDLIDLEEANALIASASRFSQSI